ncbi:hypothetical protein [Thiobaca trueperi]|uniref:hypothetical protein n=1 Tax=Thiobaca trueperi TaxID=127458 RepID=UPI0010517EE8|nr:hypothetical protein [Thiobaca trueperi]
MLRSSARIRALWGGRGWRLPSRAFLVAACPQPWRGWLLRLSGALSCWRQLARFHVVRSVAGCLFVQSLALAFLWAWSVVVPVIQSVFFL